MEYLPLILMIGAVVYFYRKHKTAGKIETQPQPGSRGRLTGKELFCTNCGYQGIPKLVTKGSFWIELVLWIFFIIPGLIYSIWRLTNRYKGCPGCGADNMIPLNSPMAKQFLPAEPAPDTKTKPPADDKHRADEDDGSVNVYTIDPQ